MNFPGRRTQTSSILIACLLSSAAIAQTDCSEEITEIDRRISTGNYSAQNVQIARQIQSTIRQMCPFLDERKRVAMRETIEGILPTMSEEERQAWQTERNARELAELPAQRAASAMLKAERDEKRRAAREAELNRPAVSPVLLSPPTGHSLAAQAVTHDDSMNQFWLWDWDVFEGRLRVLYSSFPNTAQFGLPDWQFYVYLTEITAAGEVTHRLITSKQQGDHAALMLRRGFDEILLQRQIDRPAEPAALERWSISDTRMLATVDITGRKFSLDGAAWRSRSYPLATSDGNILYIARRIGTRQDDRTRIGWFKFSPGGALLGSGTAPDIKDNFDIWSSFHTADGGAGLIINMMPIGGSRMITVPGAPANGMMANVVSEKRALIVDAAGRLALTSIAIERRLMPGGIPGIPSATPVAQVQSPAQALQNMFEQTRLLETRLDANRATVYSDVGPHRLDALKETGRGYAFLTVVTSGSDVEPPVDGPYLVEFDAGGETNRIYLASIARQLGITLKTFVASPDGRFYLLGMHQSSGDSHVVLIDREGNPVARSRTSYDRPARIVDIVADAAGVWLVGQVGRDNGQNLWVERIEFR